MLLVSFRPVMTSFQQETDRLPVQGQDSKPCRAWWSWHGQFQRSVHMQSHHGELTTQITALRAGRLGIHTQGFQVLTVGQGEENINLKVWGSTKGRDALRAVEAPLYPRIKANATQQHRNVCEAKKSSESQCCQYTFSTLPSSEFCSYSHRSDKHPGCTFTCTVPPAPENSSPCRSHARSQLSPTSLLLYICQQQQCQPDPVGLCCCPSKAS